MAMIMNTMGSRVLVTSSRGFTKNIHFTKLICHRRMIIALKENWNPTNSVLLINYPGGSPAHVIPCTKICRPFSSFTKQQNHYEILNIPRTASTEEIRSSFLRLSKLWHPDRNTEDLTRHQEFVKINEAYSVLSKPLSRRDYDMSLDAEKYVSRQMNAAASHTYGYGNSPHAGAYYHYRGHVYDEAYWAGESYKNRPKNLKTLFNFYMLISCATMAFVSITMHYMYSLPNPKHHNLRNGIRAKDMENHQLLMRSVQDGVTVYYYAIPTEDPKKYDIAIMTKSDNQSGEETMHELHRSPRQE